MVSGPAIRETCHRASAAKEVFHQLLAGQLDRYYFIFKRPRSHDVGACVPFYRRKWKLSTVMTNEQRKQAVDMLEKSVLVH